MNTEQSFQITFETFKHTIQNSTDKNEITKSLNELLVNISTLRHVLLYKNFCYPIIKNNPSIMSSIYSVDKCINEALSKCNSEERVLLLSEKILNIVSVMRMKQINKETFLKDIDIICSSMTDYKTCFEIVRLVFEIVNNMNAQQLAFGGSNMLIGELMNSCMGHLRRSIYSETSLDALLVIDKMNNYVMFSLKHQQKLIKTYIDSRRTELLRIYQENIKRMNQMKEFERPMRKPSEDSRRMTIDEDLNWELPNDSKNIPQSASKNPLLDHINEDIQQMFDDNTFENDNDWSV